MFLGACKKTEIFLWVQGGTISQVLGARAPFAMGFHACSCFLGISLWAGNTNELRLPSRP